MVAPFRVALAGDFRKPDGAPVFLEINPQGQFLFGEPLAGIDLTGAFTRFLLAEMERSSRGFNGALMFGISKKLSAGLMFGYQDFYQKYPRNIYPTGDHQVTSAVLSNSLQTLPVVAKAMVTPLAGSHSFIQPYISFGAGVSFIDYRPRGNKIPAKAKRKNNQLYHFKNPPINRRVF